MSHLIIEIGKEVGQELTIPEAGMKFGRSPANDIVLDDDAVMLFHGRFFFKSDGTLWVTDFGAGEKTRVGGEPIDEHQLKAGDLVAVGHTAFRVINVHKDSGEAIVIEPVIEMEAEAIDLGFKHSKNKLERVTETKVPASRLSHRLTLLATAFLTLLVVFLVLFSIQKIIAGNAANGSEKEYLTLKYERVDGNDINIFRYYLELDIKGNLTLSMKDLSNRTFESTVKISPDMVKKLSDRIEKTGFYALEGDQIGKEPGYNLYDLVVQRNGLMKHVKVLNVNKPSDASQQITSLLEDFVRSQMDIPPYIIKSPEELKVLATDAFEVGQKKYAAREVRSANLADAIVNFQETVNCLSYFDPKPELYLQAEDLLEQAVELRDQRYEDYMFTADRAIRLKQWSEAQKSLRYLQDLIPRDDERYDEIQRKLIGVEERLR
ncbi:MAG: FHA domain-containing protein [Pontiellaceae bacterium]|nr:FHA domain-containing protein [Pontiellaceae bacterium]